MYINFRTLSYLEVKQTNIFKNNYQVRKGPQSNNACIYFYSFHTYSASYYSVEVDAINYISNVDAEAEIVS